MAIVDVKVRLFEAHRQQMHDVSNVQIENPVVLVFDSEYRFDVILESDPFFEG